MATIVASVIAASGGDYTSVVAWEAAKPANLVTDDKVWKGRLNRNTVENPTLTGSTTDADHYAWLTSYSGEGQGRTSLLCRADVVYGLVAITSEFALIEDIGIYNGPVGACVIDTGAAATTATIRRVWASTGGVSAIAFRFGNTNAGGVMTCEACVAYNANGEGFRAHTGAGGTFNLINCLNFDAAGRGVRRVAGTMTGKNVYSASSVTADYDGTISLTTCMSSDTTAASVGGAGNSQVSVASWARRVARLATLKSYWTGENEPTAAPGKIDRQAYYRRHGDGLGTLGGDAAISGGSLTGTTGRYRLASATAPPCTSLAVRVTVPAGPLADRGFAIEWTGSDFVNGSRIYTNASGHLVGDFGNNAATAHPATWSGFAALGAGTYNIRVSLDGSTVRLYVDDEERATASFTGSRDAADSLLLDIGAAETGVSLYLGSGVSCSSAVTATGSAAPPSLPMPLYADGTGVLDDFRLTRASSATLKTGGTAAGAPTLDASGRTLRAPVSIGAHEWADADANKPGFASLTGAGGLSGNAVQRIRG